MNHSANIPQFGGVSRTKTVTLRTALATGAHGTKLPGLDYSPVLNTQLLRRGTKLPSASVSGIWTDTPTPHRFNWRSTEDIKKRFKRLYNHTVTTEEVKNLITSPSNQALCGACWAIGATDSIVDRVSIHLLKKYAKFSVTQLLSCVNKTTDRNSISLGCLGGDPYDAMQYAVKYGITFSKCGKDRTYEWCENSMLCQNRCTSDCDVEKLNDLIPPCDTVPEHCEKIHIKVNSARYIGLDNQSVPSIQKEIKREIYFNGPVVASYMVYMDFMVGTWNETDGIYIHGSYTTNDPDTGLSAHTVKLGGHAVCIVGWGKAKVTSLGNVAYWIVRNSWSDKWREEGFCKIAMTDEKRKINHQISLDRPVSGMGGVLVADVIYPEDSKLQKYTADTRRWYKWILLSIVTVVSIIGVLLIR